MTGEEQELSMTEQAVSERVREYLQRKAAEGISIDDFLEFYPEAGGALRAALVRADVVSSAAKAAESDRVLGAIQRLTDEPWEEPADEESDEQEGSSTPAALPDIRMTLVESSEDIRSTQILQPPEGPSDPEDEEEDSSVVRIRPISRPATPVLKIYDDNQLTGDFVRIRQSPFRIGRSNCELNLPHDAAIDAEHAQIGWQLDNGTYRWYLRDLDSKDGTFVKAQYSKLRHGKRIRVGRHVFRFEESDSPALVDITTGEPRDAIFLQDDEYWLGRDPTLCPSFLLNDATLDLKHAQVYQRAKGQWWVKNLGSKNGLWIEIESAELQRNCSFTLGEQRFAFMLT